MIILDTNVVSELLRPLPESPVETWLAAQDGRQVYLTSITEAELRSGVAVLDDGKRRQALSKAIDGMLREDFHGRILSFDSHAAGVYAVIAADRRAYGKPISQFDCQIAAISRLRGAVLATRNAKDFDGCGIEITNPWQR